MKPARKYIAYLLILVMPLSAWASAGIPCTQNTETPSVSETQVVDPHAHHAAGGATIESHSSESAGHAGHSAMAASGDESTPVDCPCCDDCAAMCVLSSCSPVALTTVSDAMAFNASETLLPQSDAFRVGPAPHVLFRPPIYSV